MKRSGRVREWRARRIWETAQGGKGGQPAKKWAFQLLVATEGTTGKALLKSLTKACADSSGEVVCPFVVFKRDAK